MARLLLSGRSHCSSSSCFCEAGPTLASLPSLPPRCRASLCLAVCFSGAATESPRRSPTSRPSKGSPSLIQLGKRGGERKTSPLNWSPVQSGRARTGRLTPPRPPTAKPAQLRGFVCVEGVCRLYHCFEKRGRGEV